MLGNSYDDSSMDNVTVMFFGSVKRMICCRKLGTQCCAPGVSVRTNVGTLTASVLMHATRWGRHGNGTVASIMFSETSVEQMAPMRNRSVMCLTPVTIRWLWVIMLGRRENPELMSMIRVMVPAVGVVPFTVTLRLVLPTVSELPMLLLATVIMRLSARSVRMTVPPRLGSMWLTILMPLSMWVSLPTLRGSACVLTVRGLWLFASCIPVVTVLMAIGPLLETTW